MKVLRKGNVEVGAFELPEKKKIALGIKVDDELTVYGYFQSRLGANAFIEDLALFVNAEQEEKERNDDI